MSFWVSQPPEAAFPSPFLVFVDSLLSSLLFEFEIRHILPAHPDWFAPVIFNHWWESRYILLSIVG
jgi:hypothetical protein